MTIDKKKPQNSFLGEENPFNVSLKKIEISPPLMKQREDNKEELQESEESSNCQIFEFNMPK